MIFEMWVIENPVIFWLLRQILTFSKNKIAFNFSVWQYYRFYFDGNVDMENEIKSFYTSTNLRVNRE